MKQLQWTSLPVIASIHLYAHLSALDGVSVFVFDYVIVKSCRFGGGIRNTYTPSYICKKVVREAIYKD